MRARFAEISIALLAVVLGAWPAAAAPGSQTVPTTCEIDLNELLTADSLRLPAGLRDQSLMVGGGGSVAELRCNRGAQRLVAAHLTCRTEVLGELGRNFTTKRFENPCRISLSACDEGNVIVVATNQIFKAQRKGANTIELELTCQANLARP